MSKKLLTLSGAKKVGQIASQLATRFEPHLLIDAHIPASYIVDERQRFRSIANSTNRFGRGSSNLARSAGLTAMAEFPDEGGIY